MKQWIRRYGSPPRTGLRDRKVAAPLKQSVLHLLLLRLHGLRDRKVAAPLKQSVLHLLLLRLHGLRDRKVAAPLKPLDAYDLYNLTQVSAIERSRPL